MANKKNKRKKHIVKPKSKKKQPIEASPNTAKSRGALFYLKKIGVYLSLLLNTFLILLTVFIYLPKIEIMPHDQYLDGRKRAFPITFKNTSFIPVESVSIIIDYKLLDLTTENGGSSKASGNLDILVDRIPILENNHPRTVHYGFGSHIVYPILEVKNSDLRFDVTYKLPLIPIFFNESFYFIATKSSDYSIKWYNR